VLTYFGVAVLAVAGGCMAHSLVERPLLRFVGRFAPARGTGAQWLFRLDLLPGHRFREMAFGTWLVFEDFAPHQGIAGEHDAPTRRARPQYPDQPSRYG
jgi:hypothetical protein